MPSFDPLSECNFLDMTTESCPRHGHSHSPGEPIVEPKGGFFVWTKKGHRPRYKHDTHASALKEAKRLARLNPGSRFIVQEFHEKIFVDTEVTADSVTKMEMEMQNKKYWAGIRDGNVSFFDSDPSNLDGVSAVQPFSIGNDGKITGDNNTDLVLHGDPTQQTQQSQPQTEA
jgi:hypothetical protein